MASHADDEVCDHCHQADSPANKGTTIANTWLDCLLCTHWYHAECVEVPLSSVCQSFPFICSPCRATISATAASCAALSARVSALESQLSVLSVDRAKDADAIQDLSQAVTANKSALDVLVSGLDRLDVHQQKLDLLATNLDLCGREIVDVKRELSLNRTTIDDNFEKLTSQYAGLHTDISSVLDAKLADLSSSLLSQITTSITDRVATAIQSSVSSVAPAASDAALAQLALDFQAYAEDTDERLSQHTRRLNIIIFGVPELDGGDSLAPLFSQCGIDVNTAQFRLGATQPSPVERPLPLRVTLGNAAQKQALLSLIKEYRQDPTFPISARHDQTPRQQAQYREARSELARRQAAGETGLGIRNFAVVSLSGNTYPKHLHSPFGATLPLRQPWSASPSRPQRSRYPSVPRRSLDPRQYPHTMYPSSGLPTAQQVDPKKLLKACGRGRTVSDFTALPSAAPPSPLPMLASSPHNAPPLLSVSSPLFSSSLLHTSSVLHNLPPLPPSFPPSYVHPPRPAQIPSHVAQPRRPVLHPHHPVLQRPNPLSTAHNLLLPPHPCVKKPKKTRRCRRKSKLPQPTRFGFLNIQGGRNPSKWLELGLALQAENLSFLAVAESHLRDGETPVLPDGLQWSGLNRTHGDKKGGGLGLLFPVGVTITVCKCCTEHLWFRIAEYPQTLFGLVYCASGDDPSVASWNEAIYKCLSNDLLELAQVETKICLLGDFNGHVLELGVEDATGIRLEENSNGGLMRRFVEEQDLIIGNTAPICVGQFTWHGSRSRSTVDYVLYNSNMSRYITALHIDESGTKSGGSDHNLIVVTCHPQCRTAETPGAGATPAPTRWFWDFSAENLGVVSFF